MNTIQPDAQYNDLLWVTFAGPTWDDFHVLLDDLHHYIAASDESLYLAFKPLVDMPKGSPLPHISRITGFVASEPKICHMVVMIPPNMAIAKYFGDFAKLLFPQRMESISIVSNEAALYQAYQHLKHQTV